MKKAFQCDICQLFFDDEQECIQHEVTHLNLKETFEKNVKEALQKLDQLYVSSSLVHGIRTRAYVDYYDSAEVEFEVDLKIQNEENIQSIHWKFHEQYMKDYQVKSVSEIQRELDERYYKPKFQSKYEGIFEFEDYCGGHGANDYKIGDVYMHTIFKAFQGKKVKIEIIE